MRLKMFLSCKQTLNNPFKILLALSKKGGKGFNKVG
jgi:hypothetical protein